MPQPPHSKDRVAVQSRLQVTTPVQTHYSEELLGLLVPKVFFGVISSSGCRPPVTARVS